ncbi:MAG: fibronectin type III domain-containing protein [Deltaproteobacteria bacterium]|nr:fibronectin type III domain-containing protein [Deltaproteobacteria bacterium]
MFDTGNSRKARRLLRAAMSITPPQNLRSSRFGRLPMTRASSFLPRSPLILLAVALLAGVISLLQTAPAQAQAQAQVPGMVTSAVIYGAEGPTFINFRWTAPQSSGAAITAYELQVLHAGSWSVFSTSLTTTQVTITGLTPGSGHGLRLRARNSVGWGPFAGVWTFSTQAAAPTMLNVWPDNLSLFLDWSAPPGGFSGYDVHYTSAPATGSNAVGNDAAASGSDPSAAWVALTRSGTTASQTISGLSNGTAYRVRVRALSSGPSSTWVFGSGTPVDSPPPLTAPTNPSVTPSSKTLSVSWTARPGTVTGFDVHYTSAPTSGTGAVANDAAAQGNDPATAWVAVSRSGTTTSQTITNLTLGTTYRVRVRAVNANGNSAWVFGPETTVDSTPPDAPANLGVRAVASTAACVEWTAPENNGSVVWEYAVQYERAGQTGSAIRFAPNANVPNPPTDICISGLTPETTYEIKVQAENKRGWGPYSQPLSFVTPQASQVPPADAPANVVVLSVTNTAARVSWAAPTNNVAAITAYEVHYTTAPVTGANAVADDVSTTGTDPAAAWVAVFRGGTTASQTISGLTTGTAYRVRVRYHLSDSNVSNWAFAQGTLARSTPSLAQATANGTTLTLAYSDLLNENSVPPSTAFTVKMDGEPVRLAGSNPVSISGAAVILSLAEAVDAGRKVTVSYRQLPASDPIRNSWSYKAFELLNQPVTVSGICGRTPVVREAILNELEYLIGTAPDCADVTSAQLSSIIGEASHGNEVLFQSLTNVSSLREIDFRGLSSLETLGISGTRDAVHRAELLNLNRPPSEIKRLSFPLTSLPENLFDGLSSLKGLAISGTGVTSLPENLFDGLTSLERLSIEGNPALTSLPENLFDGLSSLRGLILVQSPSLSALPENLFDGLTSLETLSISATGLTSVPEDLFDGLTSLQTLNLTHNRKLSTLSANAFNDLTNLKSLKIIFSSLSSLPRNAFNGLSSLTGLALNNNAITKVHPTVFNGLSSLTNLNLGNNERIQFRGVHTARGDNALSSLPPNLFEGLTSLTHLRLNYISLRSLPPNLFDGLPLRHLYVEGNPWLRGFPTDLFAPSHSLWVLQVNNIGLTCLTPALAQRKQLLHDGDENALPERNLPDCPAVSLSASPSSVREGSPVTITATVTAAASRDRRILLWTTPGTAETRENYGTGDIGGDDDYVPLQQIIIPAGQTSGTGIVQTIRDGDKDDETFTVALFREGSSQMPGLSHGSPSSVEVTIKETASVSVSATSLVEEGSPVTVTATLSEALPRAVRIPLVQRQGTAEPGDYEELSTSSRLGGTFEIDIPAGQTTGTATIRTTRDADGDNETFSVAIDSPFLPSVLQWGDPLEAQITIIDSAQLAQIYVSGPPDFVVHEDRDSGARFVVHLPRAVPHPFTVDYTTKDGTVSTQYKPRPKPYVANDCGVDQNGNSLDNYNWCKIPNSPAATAPADYTTTAGTLTFAPGETRKLVFVPIVNDTVSDSDENFRFAVMNPSAGARIAYGENSVVILNDEADLSALTVEGAAGSGGPWSALDIGAFEAETTDYAVTVPHGTTHARLAPTAAEPDTTMRTGAGSNLEAVGSGEPGPAVPLEAGENTLIVAAVAQSGARKTYTVTVTVTRQAGPVVAAPLADVGELEAGVSRNISLSGVFTDDDGDRLTISAGSSDTSKAAVSVAADSSALTLSGVAPGTARITVTAQDSDGNSVSDAFDVTVVKDNNPPTVASAIADATITNESGTSEVSLSGVFTDADGGDLTVTASSSAESVASVAVSADYSTLTVSAKSRGTATITVTADDGYGGSVVDSFTVRVKAAPVVASAISDVSELKVEATQEVSLSGVFSDGDGDSLTVTASSSDNAKATVTVAADQSALTVTGVSGGTATITVTAQDTDGNSVGDAFEVSVAGAEPPEGPEPWNIRVVPGDGTLTVTWNVGSRDGFDDSEIRHALRWSQEPGYAKWNNPRDPRAVGRNDGVHVPPGENRYVITGLENGVTAGVMVRSFTGHRNNMSERDPTSSKWVHVRGEHTTPVAPITMRPRSPTPSPMRRSQARAAGITSRCRACSGRRQG